VNRLKTWWQIAEATAGGASRPHVDAGGADADVEMLVRRSWLWSVVQSAATKVSAAWRGSRCRRILGAAAGDRA